MKEINLFLERTNLFMLIEDKLEIVLNTFSYDQNSNICKQVYMELLQCYKYKDLLYCSSVFEK